MLDRIEVRRAIRDRLRSAFEREQSVDDDPGVAALAAAVTEAAAAHERAREHYIGETHQAAMDAVVEETDGLLTSDGDIVFCALSDVPVFVGDRIVAIDLGFGDKGYILAEFINVDAAGVTVEVATQDDGRADDEDDPE